MDCVQLYIQNAHSAPAFPKRAHTNLFSAFAKDVFSLQQPILLPKHQKVGKERVEVALGMEMQEIREMGVVYMRKDAEELREDRFGARCKGGRRGWGKVVSGAGGEGRFVVEAVLDPGHHVVGVCRGGERDCASVTVCPFV